MHQRVQVTGIGGRRRCWKLMCRLSAQDAISGLSGNQRLRCPSDESRCWSMSSMRNSHARKLQRHVPELFLSTNHVQRDRNEHMYLRLPERSTAMIQTADRLWGRNRIPTKCSSCGESTTDYVRVSDGDKTVWLCQSGPIYPSCYETWDGWSA